MKKHLAILLCCALLCMLLPAVQAGSPYGASAAGCFQEFTGTVTGYRINVRVSPGTSAAVCGVVSCGDVIHVTGERWLSGNRLWYYGSVGGLCGWIYSAYVAGAPAPVPPAPSPSVPVVPVVPVVPSVPTVPVVPSAPAVPYTGGGYAGYTNTNAVNVRAMPYGTVIAQVRRGTAVSVYSSVYAYGTCWYHLWFYGGMGYIRADLVTLNAVPYPGWGSAGAGVGAGSGVSYYDYSNNSTTYISGGDTEPYGYSDPNYGYNGSSGSNNGYSDPNYGYNGGSGSNGGYNSAANGQSYAGGTADTSAAGGQPASIVFSTFNLSAGQTLPVYSAPNTASLRADNGTAQVSLTESIYAAGFDGQWLLVMYRNQNMMTRVGYVNAFQMQGTLPNMPSLAFGTQQAMVTGRTALTSDPMEQTDALLMLNAGDRVTYLAKLSLNGQWAYVETMVNGAPVRGFVRADAVR